MVSSTLFWLLFFVHIFQYFLLTTFIFFCVVEARIWSTEFVNILKRKLKKSWFSLDHVRDLGRSKSKYLSNTLNHWNLLNVYQCLTWTGPGQPRSIWVPPFSKMQKRACKCIGCLCRRGSFWLVGVLEWLQAQAFCPTKTIQKHHFHPSF